MNDVDVSDATRRSHWRTIALTQPQVRCAGWLATAVVGDAALGYGVYRVRIADEAKPNFDGVKLLTSTLLTFGADLVGLLFYGAALGGL